MSTPGYFLNSFYDLQGSKDDGKMPYFVPFLFVIQSWLNESSQQSNSPLGLTFKRKGFKVFEFSSIAWWLMLVSFHSTKGCSDGHGVSMRVFLEDICMSVGRWVKTMTLINLGRLHPILWGCLWKGGFFALSSWARMSIFCPRTPELLVLGSLNSRTTPLCLGPPARVQGLQPQTGRYTIGSCGSQALASDWITPPAFPGSPAAGGRSCDFPASTTTWTNPSNKPSVDK